MLPSVSFKNPGAATENKAQSDNFILTFMIFEGLLGGLRPVGNDWAYHTVHKGLAAF